MTTATKPFPPELRTMAFIPRWGVVMTLRPDYVSSHSYFVAVYSGQIAKLIGWTGNLGDLLTAALMHDAGEVVTGDLIGPTKKHILDEDKYHQYLVGKMEELGMPVEVYDDDVHLIIKAADRLDAVLFLIGEKRMGNTVAAQRIRNAMEELGNAWMVLPVYDFATDTTGDKQILMELWERVIDPAIREHYNEGGWGVT